MEMPYMEFFFREAPKNALIVAQLQVTGPMFACRPYIGPHTLTFLSWSKANKDFLEDIITEDPLCSFEKTTVAGALAHTKDPNPSPYPHPHCEPHPDPNLSLTL